MRLGAMSVALGAVATIAYGRGHLGYDAGWAMLWGEQLASGRLPAFEATGAPTPHPLANAAAVLLSPLGDAGGPVLMLLSASCFGFLAVAAHLLGARLFGRIAGVAFAAILCTRATFIGLEGQAPIDVPFVALILMAAALEVERPRRGGSVWVLVTLAGLLRPEGWLFAAAYALYLLPGCKDVRSRLRALAPAAIAPCAWAAFDLAVTGDPLHSLHGTQQLAADLERPRGLASAVSTMPIALVDVLGAPLAIAGLLGGLAAVAMLYDRALLPTALMGIGLCCFLAVGLTGLPVLNRYMIVPVVVLALFAAVILVGWRRLGRGDRRRMPWIACAVVIGGMLVAGIPGDVERVRLTVAMLDRQLAAERDLRAVARAPALRREDVRRLHVSTRRAVPLLAAWLDRPLDDVSANEPPPGARALVIRAASPQVAATFASATTPVWSPDGGMAWRELYRNRSWVLLETT